MSLVLDSAALIALDRNERAMWVRLKGCERAGSPPVTHAGVVGQVWRSGPRQARLSRALDGMDIRALDDDLGRAAGVLLGQTGKADVIDAAVVLLANDGDDILTSDRADLEPMVAAAGRHVELIRP
ncbi:MAG: hypothetical protein M1522_02680 [Actinobacteria bacterium]|nr:hypothetical protein [Actinomycetota bacterium]MDA8185158.1 hypothetical protein [Actinomycetota bacterium]